MSKIFKMVRLLPTASYRRALLMGRVAAGVEHELVLFGLDCRTVVDIGANRGQFALVARRCLPQAWIISFEPLPVPAAKFRAVFAGDTRVKLHEAAIGPVSRDATLHVSRRDDSSSLLPITAAQVALFPGTGERGTEVVREAPLREFVRAEDILPPALLKVDVQGYELEALRGCEDLLGRFDFVYAECSFLELYAGQALADEVVAWLQGRGFTPRGEYNAVHDRGGRAIQADFLFAR